MTAAAIAGTTAATTTTVAGATLVGTTTTWGLRAITMGTVAADAALVSGAVSAFSSYQAGKQAAEYGKSQQEIMNYNAMLDKREAEQTLSVAAYEEGRHRRAGEKFKAEQRVAYAHAGVTPEGSPMDILESTAINLEEDAQIIRMGGQIGASELTTSAQMRKIAGRSALLKGQAQRRAYRTAAIGEGLGTAADAYRYRLEVA